MRDEVVAAVARAPRTAAAAGTTIKAGVSSSGEGSSGASSTSSGSYGGGSRPHDRCWRCNRRGHIREECTKKESDFLTKYARCSCFGHE